MENKQKVIIGAGKTSYDGWLATQEEELNLLSEASVLLCRM